MRKYLLMFVSAVIIMSCFLGRTLVMANEDENVNPYKRYYTTIEIEPGDSLWSIAQTYNHNSGMEIREYIRELKQMNQMLSDNIRAGEDLTIVYFSKEPYMK